MVKEIMRLYDLELAMIRGSSVVAVENPLKGRVVGVSPEHRLNWIDGPLIPEKLIDRVANKFLYDETPYEIDSKTGYMYKTMYNFVYKRKN